MKAFGADLTTHYNSRNTTLATALKITRTDGVVYAFTNHDVDDVIEGVTYLSDPGIDISSVEIAANAAVGNLELTTLHDGTVFTTADILSGVWRNAAFTLFRYNYANLSGSPTPTFDTLLVGTLGECQLRRNTVVVELRDLRQYLQQPIGDVSTKTCRARLGDSRCGVVLTGSPTSQFVKTGTLTSVTSAQVFRDSSRAEAVNWFDEGEFTWTSGDNSGLSAKVKSYAADGTFTLALPMITTPQVGDTYTAIAGCRKRLAEDCAAKFNNVLNFVGEPHRLGVNSLTSTVAVDV